MAKLSDRTRGEPQERSDGLSSKGEEIYLGDKKQKTDGDYHYVAPPLMLA